MPKSVLLAITGEILPHNLYTLAGVNAAEKLSRVEVLVVQPNEMSHDVETQFRHSLSIFTKSVQEGRRCKVTSDIAVGPLKGIVLGYVKKHKVDLVIVAAPKSDLHGDQWNKHGYNEMCAEVVDKGVACVIEFVDYQLGR